MTWPNTAYLPSSSGAARERDVDLAVGRAGSPGCASATAPLRVQTLRRSLGDADRLCRSTPSAPRPQSASRDRSRDRGSPHCTTKPGQRAMDALAVVEAALHELDDVRDRLRRLVRIGLELERPLRPSRRRSTGARRPARDSDGDAAAETQRHAENARAMLLCDLAVSAVLFCACHALPTRVTPICGQCRADDARRRSADTPGGRRSVPRSRDTG